MNCMLLAAGRSTRLGALGSALPKPLLPICGYPAIEFGLHAALRAGTDRVVVNLHHHGDMIRAALGQRAIYSVEDELLGTGGGIAKARPLFDDGPLLVMNAKVVADLDLPGLLAAHAAGGDDVEATMLLRDDPNPGQWGAIGVDATGRVVRILTVPSPRPPQGPVTERMFTGVHILSRALMDRLRPVFCDVIRDAYIPALRAGATIRAATLTGYFAEHSTPLRYLQGNLALLETPALLRDPPGPLVGVDPSASIEPIARVKPPCRIEAGVVVDYGAFIASSVLGAGSHVAENVRVVESVVWPGARVTANASYAIVTPEGTVDAAMPLPRG